MLDWERDGEPSDQKVRNQLAENKAKKLAQQTPSAVKIDTSQLQSSVDLAQSRNSRRLALDALYDAIEERVVADERLRKSLGNHELLRAMITEVLERMFSKHAVVGVYRYTCKVNNRTYVGASTNCLIRYGTHTKDLLEGKCKTKRFQSDFTKYGIGAFDWNVIGEAPALELLTDLEYTFQQIALSKDIPLYNKLRDPDVRKEWDRFGIFQNPVAREGIRVVAVQIANSMGILEPNPKYAEMPGWTSRVYTLADQRKNALDVADDIDDFLDDDDDDDV